jgi:hypothetical protein
MTLQPTEIRTFVDSHIIMTEQLTKAVFEGTLTDVFELMRPLLVTLWDREISGVQLVWDGKEGEWTGAVYYKREPGVPRNLK